jgi:hypothetical protein
MLTRTFYGLCLRVKKVTFRLKKMSAFREKGRSRIRIRIPNTAIWDILEQLYSETAAESPLPFVAFFYPWFEELSDCAG